MGEQVEAGRRAIWLHCLFFFSGLVVNNQLNLDGIEKLLYRLLISTVSRPAKSYTLRKRHLSDFSHTVPCIFRKQVMHLQLYFWTPQFLFCFMIPCARQTSAAQSVICQSATVGAMGHHGVGEKLLHWAALQKCDSSNQKGPDRDISETWILCRYVRGYVPPTQFFHFFLFCSDLTWRVACTRALRSWKVYRAAV